MPLAEGLPLNSIAAPLLKEFVFFVAPMLADAGADLQLGMFESSVRKVAGKCSQAWFARYPLDLQANNLVVLINKQTDKVNQRAS